jgi:hypothetical protein
LLIQFQGIQEVVREDGEGSVLTIVVINSIATLGHRSINTSLHNIDNKVSSDVKPFLIWPAVQRGTNSRRVGENCSGVRATRLVCSSREIINYLLAGGVKSVNVRLRSIKEVEVVDLDRESERVNIVVENALP